MPSPCLLSHQIFQNHCAPIGANLHVVVLKSKHLQLQDRNLLALHRAKMVVEHILQPCFECLVAISTRQILRRHEQMHFVGLLEMHLVGLQTAAIIQVSSVVNECTHLFILF